MMINKDTGDWLSAQQAVRPDGTEVGNLPLVNKKLPPLYQASTMIGAPYSQRTAAQYCSAIDFAINMEGLDGLVFLELWRRGAWSEISMCFPEFRRVAQDEMIAN
ncbi:hypothetical protein [Sapientia aquatica]|uniref:Uncharacterized protein n=1 Tax=Sapientia aquatica TaxID=1549640 RepID=A0A4R5W458_9BURK|nr:hypothetical protein [Sapientia aquatica]TDK67563.1 hypothetical protein E2I14_07395 [Sapientia aquatica]